MSIAPNKSSTASQKPKPVVDRKRLSEIKHELASVAQFTDVLVPEQADEPVLAKPVRSAIFEWLYELNAESELAAMRLEPRRSALLYGPPGTGKTTLAHHLAARLGMPLVVVQSDQVSSKYMGATQENLATLFRALKKFGTSVVTLMDEIDGIGASRANVTGSAGERDANSTVNSLLTRMQDHPGVLIAATNRREGLDAALWRRFAMQIEVALPEYDERYAILDRYFDPITLDEEAIQLLADLTTGASPSLLRQLAEGVKRKMVFARRSKREIEGFKSAITSVAATIAPPPGMDTPPLWKNSMTLQEHAEPPWPPLYPDGGQA